MAPRHAFGPLLCALLLFFAVGAKIAPYHPQTERDLSSTKIWTSKSAPSATDVASVPVQIVPAALWLLTVLPVAVFAITTFYARREEVFFLPPPLLSAPLAVRPPPSR